jgi:hypothetical protein
MWLFFGQMWNPHHKLLISQNLNIISAKIVNNMFVQNQWIPKCKNGSKNTIIFAYDVSFILMMSWCEVCTIYILIKSMQISWYKFA